MGQELSQIEAQERHNNEIEMQGRKNQELSSGIDGHGEIEEIDITNG